MLTVRWTHPNTGQVHEIEMDNDPPEVDVETLGRVAAAIRGSAQGSSTRTQVEIDGVIERYRRGGARMTGPYGPGPV